LPSGAYHPETTFVLGFVFEIKTALFNR
jgi:hypothetical protein